MQVLNLYLSQRRSLLGLSLFLCYSESGGLGPVVYVVKILPLTSREAGATPVGSTHQSKPIFGLVLVYQVLMCLFSLIFFSFPIFKAAILIVNLEIGGICKRCPYLLWDVPKSVPLKKNDFTLPFSGRSRCRLFLILGPQPLETAFEAYPP